MKTFETRGPVDAARNYVVKRTTELADFVNRVKQGRYIVIFAPRQTGKTTFFRWALDVLAAEGITYFPIQLNFEAYKNLNASVFYGELYQDIREQIGKIFQKQGHMPSEALHQYLQGSQVTDHLSMLRFFRELENLLKPQRLVMVIDEFDGIPQTVVSDFLHSLRRIYLSGVDSRCPFSLGIVGVKSITQLNYDRSISPFNIQDEFALPNFTLEQVQELLADYTEAVGQPFSAEVIEALHKQTAGQPFLVNRFAQILTEELNIPKTECIDMTHFSEAHTRLLREQNVNIQHLITNIRREPRFKTLLMEIVSYDRSVEFNLDNEYIGELATYGVIAEGSDGQCEIVNPIYQYRIMKAFQPLINGLEREYFPEDAETDFLDYLTSEGRIRLQPLLDNFQNFIARVGYKILQVPETPKEFVGQYLLFAYLEQFVRLVKGRMYLEVRTGRGRMDLLILHNSRKYIVETKIWEGERSYTAGKKQLAAYMRLEDAAEGYYVVFDHRKNPEQRTETETIEGFAIQSYVIPVMQEPPSQAI
ncbi:MAG: AAA-like domain-containing protein [Candidatus Poribacteria bacterium]|nr:AAA-like domain-containing protein [Candidatus Poribacteria bacterium]